MRNRESKKTGWLRRNCRRVISPVITLVILAALVFTMATPALASYYLDGDGDTQSSFDGVHWEAQTFTATETFCLTGVHFQIWADPEYTGTITVSLRSLLQKVK